MDTCVYCLWLCLRVYVTFMSCSFRVLTKAAVLCSKLCMGKLWRILEQNKQKKEQKTMFEKWIWKGKKRRHEEWDKKLTDDGKEEEEKETYKNM
jgi:hypothetical protein